MSDILAGERALAAVVGRRPARQFVRTGSPNVLCSALPAHWRCNKVVVVLRKSLFHQNEYIQ